MVLQNNYVRSSTIFDAITIKNRTCFQYESYWFFVQSVRNMGDCIKVTAKMQNKVTKRIDDKIYEFTIIRET